MSQGTPSRKPRARSAAHPGGELGESPALMLYQEGGGKEPRVVRRGDAQAPLGEDVGLDRLGHGIDVQGPPVEDFPGGNGIKEERGD